MAYRFPEITQRVDTAETKKIYYLDNLVACAKKGKLPGALSYPQAVAIDPATNHIYVAEGDLWNNFARVSIFSESGEYLDSFTHENMKALCGIAIHRNNVYLTDIKLHAVFLLNMADNFQLVNWLGSRGSEIGQFEDPRQISISDINGDVYIADYGNDRIQILDRSLRPFTEVKHWSLHRPCDVKLTTDEMYVLSPIDSPCVHVFSRYDNKVRSLITRGIGMQVTTPYYFCLFANKVLAISDWNSHQIKIFNYEGVLLHMLGEWGHKVGMFSVPNGLAFTSNLKLVTVSWNESYRLQIFSLYEC